MQNQSCTSTVVVAMSVVDISYRVKSRVSISQWDGTGQCRGDAGLSERIGQTRAGQLQLRAIMLEAADAVSVHSTRERLLKGTERASVASGERDAA